MVQESLFQLMRLADEQRHLVAEIHDLVPRLLEQHRNARQDIDLIDDVLRQVGHVSPRMYCRVCWCL
jgi:hypothetical protein